MRHTMQVKEVVKALVQSTKWTSREVEYIVGLCRTYRNAGDPTRVDADDLQEVLVHQCGILGDSTDWNKLASMVCTTIEC